MAATSKARRVVDVIDLRIGGVSGFVWCDYLILEDEGPPKPGNNNDKRVQPLTSAQV